MISFHLIANIFPILMVQVIFNYTLFLSKHKLGINLSFRWA